MASRTSKDSSLHAVVDRCITNGDSDELRRLLRDGVNPDFRNARGDTLLIKASNHENLDCMEALIEAGADVNARNKQQRTALMKAASRGDLDFAALLLAAGANLFLQDSTGKTALDWARMSHHAVVSDFLEAAAVKALARELDDATHDRQLKLRREVLAVNEDHIRRLSVAMKTKGRATAAILAMVTTCTLTRAKFNEAVAAEAVASGGAHVEEAAEVMLKADAEMKEGAGGARRRVVPLIGKRTWEEGDPALPQLRAKWKSEPRYYLDAEDIGFTALIKACIEDEVDAVRTLITAGATIDLETAKGFTALGWACILGHRDVVFVLLQHGAIIDYPSFTEHKTPLMHAAYNGRDENRALASSSDL